MKDSYRFTDLKIGQKVKVIEGEYIGKVAEVESITVTKIKGEYLSSYQLKMIDSEERLLTVRGHIIQPI